MRTSYFLPCMLYFSYEVRKTNRNYVVYKHKERGKINLPYSRYYAGRILHVISYNPHNKAIE